MDAAAETGYDTTEKVARFVDLLTPRLFGFLGEEFREEYLREPVTSIRENVVAAVQAPE